MRTALGDERLTKESKEHGFKERGLARFVLSPYEDAPRVGKHEVYFFQLFEIVGVQSLEADQFGGMLPSRLRGEAPLCSRRSVLFIT